MTALLRLQSPNIIHGSTIFGREGKICKWERYLQPGQFWRSRKVLNNHKTLPQGPKHLLNSLFGLWGVVHGLWTREFLVCGSKSSDTSFGRGTVCVTDYVGTQLPETCGNVTVFPREFVNVVHNSVRLLSAPMCTFTKIGFPFTNFTISPSACTMLGNCSLKSAVT